MQIDYILDYFIEYEANEMMMHSVLKNTEGKDYCKDILNDRSKLKEELLGKKASKIYEYLNKKNIKFKNNDGKEPTQLILESLESKSSELLKSHIELNDKRSKIDFEEMFSRLANEEQVTICYPILEKRKSKHPVFVFNFDIKADKWRLVDFSLTNKSLQILIAHCYEIDLSDVEGQYGTSISKVMESIKNIEGQSDVLETIKLVDGILAHYFRGISTIESFKRYDEWEKIDKVFVTTEHLDEMYKPPFADELKIVKDKLNKIKEPPLLLTKYLLSNNAQKSYESIENGFKVHYGSYQSDYAINRKQWDVTRSVDSIDMLSVNGPPGTGKTTLIKEIIADQLVSKARALISIWDANWESINDGKKAVFQSPFKGENRYSMIVTSTNNKAVDNIGGELLLEVPYFKDYVNEDSANDGLLCARLGNKENIDTFKKDVLLPLLSGLRKDESSNERVVEEFNRVYKEVSGIYQEINELQTSYINLIEKLEVKRNDDLESLTNQFNDSIKAIEDHNSTFSKQKVRVQEQIDKLVEEIERLDDELLVCKSNQAQSEKKLKTLYIASEKLKHYNKFRILYIFSKKRKSFFEKYPSKEYIDDCKVRLEDQKIQIEEKIQVLDSQIRKSKDEEMKFTREVYRLSEKISETESKKQEIYNNINIIKLIEEKKKNLEKTLDINIDPTDTYKMFNGLKIVELRKRLFDLSLLVHQEYIKKHKQVILHNLDKVTEEGLWFKAYYNSENEYSSSNREGIKALWETLFLCFPVVTTTLHSFHTKTFQMIEGLFDILLVDESGQVLPHYLVGPLYRARRVVAVGDIYQLEPIRLQKNDLIKKYHQINHNLHELINIETNSVQSFVDHHSDIFEQDDKQKMGIMLEEHRRCENSIAQFSNIYVYNRKLKIIKKDNHSKLFGSNLVAFDVRGIVTKGNVNELEVDICKRIINEYVSTYGEDIKREIAIITPYKNQELRLKKILDKAISIGTVHTFQGQEKKIVLFSAVIDDTSKVRFLGEKPNMLNVAFTRGKEQFVFVGNIQVALDSSSYLKDALATIQRYGVIYSLFNQKLNMNKERFQIDSFRIFTNQIKLSSSSIGLWINRTFKSGIIGGSLAHYQFLHKSLELAEKSIVIISPWITEYVVNQEFLYKLQCLINRGIEVSIKFGYHNTNYDIHHLDRIVEVDYSNGREIALPSIQRLQRLLKEQLVYAPPLHIKLLLIDGQYLFIA